jgi:hypothetical protein
MKTLITTLTILTVLQVLHAAAENDVSKPDFSGTWKLDRSISTDPAQISFAPVPIENRRQRSGFGGGFGRTSGGTRRPTGRATAEDLTPLEQERLKALTEELKTASATLVISHHDPAFVVNDAQDHTLFFRTTGESDENHAGATTITSSTHWDGARLVTECVLGSRLTLTYSYALLPNTNQLVIRVARKTDDRRHAGQDVRLVYRPGS